jgi:predicted AAA+ superfamily ATPase
VIDRYPNIDRLNRLFRDFPVVALIGARQVGKSTLAREFAAAQPPGAWFDLESHLDVARLESPLQALAPLTGLVVFDEIHRRPDLFDSLRVLADRPGRPASFLVLGSASPELSRQSAESLAGRIAYVELGGFDLAEVGASAIERRWLRGGFPRAFLAESDEASAEWREQFIRSYLERDLPGYGFRLDAMTMRRFWTMLAHYHGQTWNGSELGRAFGVTEKTVHRYLDVLGATFMVRRLAPWFENVSKRQVKAPKVYLADSGVLHALLGLRTTEDLRRHPKVGASFEGFALEQVVARLGAKPQECFFWGLHSGGELDLLVVRGNRRLGFEFKSTDSPRSERGMHGAITTLGLERLDVIHAGQLTWPIAEGIRAVALCRILEDLEPLS